MNYTVIWSSRAERRLAELWLDQRFRPLLAGVAASLDTQLALNGPDVGESRDRGRRIHFDPPFGIIFRCDEAARRVVVLYFWAY